MFPNWKAWDYTYTAEGLRKEALRSMVKNTLFISAILGMFYARRNGVALKSIPGLVKQFTRERIVNVLAILQYGLAQVASRV
jgi:hypothetical protein